MAGKQSALPGHMVVVSVAQALGLGIAEVGKNTAAALVAGGVRDCNFGAVAVVVQPAPVRGMSSAVVAEVGSGSGRAPGQLDMWRYLPGSPWAQVRNDIEVLHRMDYSLR